MTRGYMYMYIMHDSWCRSVALLGSFSQSNTSPTSGFLILFMYSTVATNAWWFLQLLCSKLSFDRRPVMRYISTKVSTGIIFGVLNFRKVDWYPKIFVLENICTQKLRIWNFVYTKISWFKVLFIVFYYIHAYTVCHIHVYENFIL